MKTAGREAFFIGLRATPLFSAVLQRPLKIWNRYTCYRMGLLLNFWRSITLPVLWKQMQSFYIFFSKGKTTLVDIITQDAIETKIWTIRGVRVMVDHDLAFLYDVPTGHLKRAVKRNLLRFPKDFMFQLTKEESLELSRCQIGILKRGQNIKYSPDEKKWMGFRTGKWSGKSIAQAIPSGHSLWLVYKRYSASEIIVIQRLD